MNSGILRLWSSQIGWDSVVPIRKHQHVRLQGVCREALFFVDTMGHIGIYATIPMVLAKVGNFKVAAIGRPEGLELLMAQVEFEFAK